MRLRPLGLATALLMSLMSAAWAEGPEFPIKADGTPPCVIAWSTGTSFNVYVSPTPGSTGALFASVQALPGIGTYNVACPREVGQHYIALTAVSGAVESAPTRTAFVITDGSPPAFVVGATVKVTASLLYVRAAPSPTGGVLAYVSKGATGIIREGPIAAGGATWWRVQYGPNLIGWSSQAFLSL